MKFGGWLFAAALSMAGLFCAGEASAQTKFIVNQLSGKCIDVSGAPGVKNGAPLILYTCEFGALNPNGTPTDQMWEVLPQGFIRNALSGKCIDVPGAPGIKAGTALILYDCEMSGRNPNGSTTDQQWQFTKEGLIRHKLSGLCLDVRGGPATANGAPLQLATCEVAGGPSDQYWRLK
ncbi:RICIN domain-containing protein [Xanthobacter wiegelii]|uniref:RICIN domain-containing protein n=1 Tax=Xanthobacter wiegelii TaxID=3119913 RepID=UPI0037289476